MRDYSTAAKLVLHRWSVKTMSYNIESEIKCPFYIGMGVACLRCESVFADSDKHMFVNQKSMFKHINCYCTNDNMKNCPQHKAMIEKYGGDRDEC